MHEFGITSRIVQTVLRVAENNGATKVVEVDLQIGQLTFLNPSQVKLAYDILAKGTLLEGSELSIQEVEGLVKCDACNHEQNVRMPDDPINSYEPLPLFSCSECGGKVKVIQGKECQVVGVALQT